MTVVWMMYVIGRIVGMGRCVGCALILVGKWKI